MIKSYGCQHKQTIPITEEHLNEGIDTLVYSCANCGTEIRNETEEIEKKMTYDPTKGKEGEDKAQLPKDTILDGVIIQIEDGTLPDFVKEEYLKTWKGNTESPAINVTVECKAGEENVTVTHLFTYISEDGNTVYTPKSNLGKFVKKYEELPKVGLAVKVITNNDGFGKIKLE